MCNNRSRNKINSDPHQPVRCSFHFSVVAATALHTAPRSTMIMNDMKHMPRLLIFAMDYYGDLMLFRRKLTSILTLCQPITFIGSAKPSEISCSPIFNKMFYGWTTCANGYVSHMWWVPQSELVPKTVCPLKAISAPSAMPDMDQKGVTNTVGIDSAMFYLWAGKAMM